jgi:hypothetical protein
MTRTTCRCRDGRCACTRNGRAVPAPPALHTATHSAAEWHARRHAWRVYADASGAAQPGRVVAEVVTTYAQLVAAGRQRDATPLLAALKRIGAQRRRAQLAEQFAALEARVHGAAGAARRQQQRRDRVTFDHLAERVHGPAGATARRIWSRVHPGQPYPRMASPRPAPNLGAAARTAGPAPRPGRAR